MTTCRQPRPPWRKKPTPIMIPPFLLQQSRSPSSWRMKTRKSRRSAAGSASRSAPNVANAYSITIKKMLDSLTTTPTMICATSSTSGMMSAPLSSPRGRNVRKLRHVAPPPTTTSTTTTRSQHVRGRTSGPTTRKRAHPGQPLYFNKADELQSSRIASSELSTSAAHGTQWQALGIRMPKSTQST